METKFGAPLLAYIYTLFVGVSYLWGYWLPFNLNILDFIDINDVLKASIYPAIPAIGLLIINSVLEGMGVLSKENREIVIQAGGIPKYTLIGQGLFSILASVGFIIYGCYLIGTEEGYYKIQGAYVIGSILATTYFFQTESLVHLDNRFRTSIIIFICMLPMYVFDGGVKASKALIALEGDYWVVHTKETCSNTKGQLILIERLGGKFFTMDSENKSLCILQDANIGLTKMSTVN